MNRYVITREQINGQEYQVFALYDEAKHMVEVSLAKEGCASLLGNIYIGRVEHVLGNLNAAFVKISPEQRCYLSLDDLKAPVFTRKLSKKKALAEGEELLVQVTREAIKTKEPAVTADLSLSGTYAVVSTGNKKCGVSAKLPKERRKHFTELLGQTTDDRYGIVVRTNAGNASDEAVLAEIADLQRQCDGLLAAAKHKDCFGLLYEKPPLFLRELDNLRTDSLEQIVTDDRQVFEQVCAHYHIPQEALVTKGCVPAPVDTAAAGEQLQIRFYRDDAVSLSTLYSVKSHLKDALRERVWLKSGAYLIIQPTEALTVIDVNTGKNVAKRDVQEHFLHVNTEAAEEIARQLRLRNLSGIIIVDFINLTDRSAQDALLSQFRAALKRDPVPVRLAGMTKLGLVELTRKKGKQSLAESLRAQENSP